MQRSYKLHEIKYAVHNHSKEDVQSKLDEMQFKTKKVRLSDCKNFYLAKVSNKRAKITDKFVDINVDDSIHTL